MTASLEIHEAAGALESSSDGFERRASSLRAASTWLPISTSATGSPRRFVGGIRPLPPEPCPLPLVACTVRESEYIVRNDNGRERRFRDRPLAADLERRRLRRGRSARAERDRARRRLPGQPRAAPLGTVRGRSGRARRPPLCPRSTQSRALPGQRLDDRLGLAGALPRAAWEPRVDVPDQGDAPGGRRRASSPAR